MPSARSGQEQLDHFGLVFTAVLGLVLAAAWWLLLKSYRDLNRAKFAVIHELEKNLQTRPFTREWEIIKAKEPQPLRRRYAELGIVERVVPLAFAGLYIAAIVRFA